MDVYVAPGHRHKGIARHMVRFSLDHPELSDFYQWLLATRDAHAVYSAVCFNLLTNPERWMMLMKQRNAT